MGLCLLALAVSTAAQLNIQDPSIAYIAERAVPLGENQQREQHSCDGYDSWIKGCRLVSPSHGHCCALRLAGFSQACLDGHILNADGSCSPCPAGTWTQVRAEQVLAKHSRPAAAFPASIACIGSPQASIAVPQCFSLQDNIRCVPCPTGSFAATAASNLCQLCPEGQISGPGASSCTPCPAGMYQPTLGGDVCQTCPAGKCCHRNHSCCCSLQCKKHRPRACIQAFFHHVCLYLCVCMCVFLSLQARTLQQGPRSAPSVQKGNISLRSTQRVA